MLYTGVPQNDLENTLTATHRKVYGDALLNHRFAQSFVTQAYPDGVRR